MPSFSTRLPSHVVFVALLLAEDALGHVPGDHHHGHHHSMHQFRGPMAGRHHAAVSAGHHDPPEQQQPGHRPQVVTVNNQYNDHNHEHESDLVGPAGHEHHVHHVTHDLPGDSKLSIMRHFVRPPTTSLKDNLPPEPQQLTQPALPRLPQPHQAPTIYYPTGFAAPGFTPVLNPFQRYIQPYPVTPVHMEPAPKLYMAPTMAPASHHSSVPHPEHPHHLQQAEESSRGSLGSSQPDPPPELHPDGLRPGAQVSSLDHTPELHAHQHQPGVQVTHPDHPHHNHHDDRKYSPFDPRFAVDREEVSDAEWRAEIYSVFHASGIVPDVLPHVPLGLVNVNFGTHNCVHMGTVLDSETSAYEPSAVSWPADKEKLYTLLMVDLDNSFRVHWLEVNIPGSDIDGGDTIAEYDSPAPKEGEHRYLLMVMEQMDRLPISALVPRLLSHSCQDRGRHSLPELRRLRQQLRLLEPLAANYFVVKNDDFANSIIEFCEDRQQQQQRLSSSSSS